jgi:hypothetical protein
MTNSAKQAVRTKTKKSPGYRYLGTTSDGVKIIRPKMKATHFTPKQIRATILKVLRESAVRK